MHRKCVFISMTTIFLHSSPMASFIDLFCPRTDGLCVLSVERHRFPNCMTLLKELFESDMHGTIHALFLMCHVFLSSTRWMF